MHHSRTRRFRRALTGMLVLVGPVLMPAPERVGAAPVGRGLRRAAVTDPAALLPDPHALPGLPAAEAIEHYDPGNLYEAIDGQATAFVEYGFVGMAMRTYASPPSAGTAGGPQSAITVKVYDMGTRLQAFGALSQLHPPEARPVAVGASGWLGRDQVLFAHGRFLVEVAYSGTLPSGARSRLLARVARAAASRAPGRADLPPELALLPRKTKRPNSERFLLRNALGLDFLHHALSADYVVGRRAPRPPACELGRGGPLQLTLAMMADAREAQAAFSRFAGLLGNASLLRPAVGDTALEGTHEYYGRALACRKGRFLVIIPKVEGRRAAAIALLRAAPVGR